ncbi:MAG: hypothetical protein ACJ8MH_16770 [Povalibacter sp.]
MHVLHEGETLGYWVNTTFIRCASVEKVVTALEKLLLSENMERIVPAQRQRLPIEPMQYESALANDLWGLAVFPGAAGWTVIHSAPLQLLAESPQGSTRPRLASLCQSLKSSALTLNVYDSTGVILAECDAEGDVLVCGFSGQGGSNNPYQAHDDAVTEDTFALQLRVHADLALDLKDAWGEDLALIFKKHCGGANGQHCDNLISVDTLISHKPLNIAGGQALYFKWPGPSRQRRNACTTWEEYNRAE